MRCVERNKQTFYYALYNGEEEVKDTDGYYTGAMTPSYSAITKAKGNIAPTTGKTVFSEFGTDYKDYARVILMESSPITVNSVVWIGIAEPTMENYNFIVRRVAQGLNSVAIALTEVHNNED